MRNIKTILKVIYGILLSPILYWSARHQHAIHQAIIRPLTSGPFKGKLIGEIWDHVYQLESGAVDNDSFTQAVCLSMQNAVRDGQIDYWLKMPTKPEQNIDISLCRSIFYTPLKRWHLNLHFMAEGNIHNPHGHRDVLSTQVIAKGRMKVQEFDLIDSLEKNPTTLIIRRDEVVDAVSGFITTDSVCNVHGFEPYLGPAVRFQFYLRGQGGIKGVLFPKRGRLYVHPIWDTRDGNTVLANLGRSGRPGES
ncbi:MAG: hypothetical protein AB7E12_12565 [Burkholderiaceae bacterium]